MKRIKRLLGAFACASVLLGLNVAYAQDDGRKLPETEVLEEVFHADFENDALNAEWLIVDADKDGNAFRFRSSGFGHDYSASLCYDADGDVPDDWAISPMMDLPAGRYRISYYVCDYESEVKVYIGSSRDEAAMSRQVSAYKGYGGLFVHAEFNMEKSGSYCVGFKVGETMVSSSLYIDEVRVERIASAGTPQTVQELVQVPGENGAATMSLRWKNPSYDVAGESLASLTSIEIYKNYGNTPETYSLSLQPGASVEWTDPDPRPGKVTYHVYAVNASGRSTAAIVNTFIGEDLPSAPRNLKAELVNGKIAVSWDAPGQFGLNGGWYDKTGLKYLLARTPDYTVLEAGATTTSYTDEVEAMNLYYYEVSAYNDFGKGGKAVSEGLKVGTAMGLPFHEDFEDPATFTALWSTLDKNEDGAVWVLDYSRGNRQPRAVCWNWLLADWESGDPSADDWLFTPMFRLESGKKYRMRYSMETLAMIPYSLQIAIGKTVNPEAMNTIEHLKDYTGTGVWEDRVVEFESPGSGNFCIGFYYYDGGSYLWLDDITIEEVVGKDLAVNRIRGLMAPTAGSASTYSVEVENRGTSAARGFTLQLVDDMGTIVADTTVSRSLAAGRTSEYSLQWTPANTNVSSLRARVVYEEDEIEGNNQSPSFAVMVQGKGNKAVQVGEQEVLSYHVPWYVGYASGFGQMVFWNDWLGGMVGELTGIAWQLQAGLSDTLKDQSFRLWVGETDRYDMNGGWFGPDELTCVFDSTVDIAPGVYDWYLPFQIPYDYKGGYLVLCIEGRNELDLGAPGMQFVCSEMNWNAVSRTDFGTYSSLSMDNLDETQGMFYNLLPNTTFFFNVENTGSVKGVVKNAGGEALSQVRVQVDGLNLRHRTAVDGSYALPYVKAGDQTFRFELAGYETLSEQLDVPKGQAVTLNATMQPLPVVKLSGIVVGSDNRTEGIANAEIELDGLSDYTVTTDEDGRFTIEEMYGSSDYALSVSAVGYDEYVDELSIGAVDMEMDTIVLEKMVNMPSFVYAYDKTDHALVEWDEPVPVVWLQKDNGEFHGSLGGGGTAVYIIGVRFTPEDFEKAALTASSALSRISFFPNAVADFTLKVFAGEDGLEALVYQEVIPVENFGTWCEFALSDAVPLDPDKNLIVGIEVQQGSGSSPIGFDPGPAIENADLFSQDDGLTWVPVEEVSPSMDYNWLLHAYFSADPNAAPNDLADLMSVRQNPVSPLSIYGTADQRQVVLDRGRTKAKAQESVQWEVNLASKAERSAAVRKSPMEEKAASVYSYEVYRLLNGQEKDYAAWTAITSTPVTERSVRDDNWQPLEDTMYRYAVRSVLDGVYSDYTFSKAVDKGKYSTVSMQVATNTDESAQGAIVTLRGLNNVYVDTVDADGNATLTDIHFGNYQLSVRKEWYETYRRDSLELNEHEVDLGKLELIEDVIPPKDFVATDWVDYVDLEWDAERLIEVELSKTNGQHADAIGMMSGGLMEVGQRFTPDELREAGVEGYYLHEISFWPDTSGADFSLKVWKSDYVGQEREFYSQEIPAEDIVSGQWNTVELDVPVLIDANQSYVFGYSANMSAGMYPVGYDAGPMVEGGDMIWLEGEWLSFTEAMMYTYDHNWMIQALVSNGTLSKSLSKASDDLDYTYEVFRFAQKDSADFSAWNKVSGNELRETELIDNAWKDQPDGNYYYAAFSRSSAGNTSDTVLSTLLPKGQVSVVTVSATTNNGASAAGASVRLVSSEETYSGVLGEDASVQIPAVMKGSYALHITKTGFDELSKQVEINDDKTTLSGNELKESLLAPLSVRAMKDESEQVRLDWYSPMTEGAYPHYITWSSNAIFTGIGQGNSAFSFSAAHKYTVADLEEQKVVGSYVHKIRFWAVDDPNYPTTDASFVLGIWEGESGTQVYRQTVPVSDIKWNAWTEVTLRTPYYIEGDQILMFGYTCDVATGYVGGIDKGPAIRGKGNMLNVDGSWITLTGLQAELDYNWMIQVYCTDALEAGVDASKAGGDADFVKSWTVYRLTDGQQNAPDKWTELASETTDMSLSDNLSGLADDWYLYAVKAHYATGESDYAFSNVLGKGVGNEGLQADELPALAVTPNPNRGQFSLELPFAGNLRIFDLQGRLVWSRDMSEGLHSMDLNLASGSYLLMLVSDGGQAQGRLVIAR